MSNWIIGADAPKTPAPKIYDESADGSKQIAEAVTLAKKEDKRVLLQFGATEVLCYGTAVLITKI